VNTDTEQDEQRDHEIVDISAAVGEHSDTTTEQGSTHQITRKTRRLLILTLTKMLLSSK